MTSMDGHREAIRSPDSQQATAKASLVSPELSLPHETLGLLGNVSSSSPTSSIMAAEGGSWLSGPWRNASGSAAASLLKKRQNQASCQECIVEGKDGKTIR
ncbi:unnamed protein product [Pleuronectes platessa]|uniref:Uncharacterized protein n=1 Tax=Pleuronectes platessa TaxID=8262 RepID=A0A9N7U1L9_PLEPL|nr:unnamed protein product [Pleuronectes platessa]